MNCSELGNQTNLLHRFVECIIRPDVGRPSTTTSINHVLQAGRNTLKELDTEIQSGQDESSRLETSREYLQQLLDGDQLTELYVELPRDPVGLF